MIGNREGGTDGGTGGGREGGGGEERGVREGVGGRYSLFWDMTCNIHRDATDNCHRYVQCTHTYAHVHTHSLDTQTLHFHTRSRMTIIIPQCQALLLVFSRFIGANRQAYSTKRRRELQ